MKRGKRALILAGVLAALVLVYAGVQKSVSQPETVTEESGTYALTAHTAEELTGPAVDERRRRRTGNPALYQDRRRGAMAGGRRRDFPGGTGQR